MIEQVAYGVALLTVVGLVAILWYLRWSHLQSMQRHYALCKLKLKNLPKDSPTRQRIEAAQDTFRKGWKALKTKDQYSCLSYFATAVEIDELGCTWKQQFEKKLEQISDFFTLPPKDDLDKYQSMLAEAYLVVLLHTVVSSQGGQDKDFEEDFRVVKTRLDVCVSLQPNNPAIYMIRGDMLQRFGYLANRIQVIADFEQAINLALADTEGKSLNVVPGLDPIQQRRYVLALSYHQLASLQHRNKDMEKALDSYTKCVEYADPAFIYLADSHFSVCIIHIIKGRSASPDTKKSVLSKASHHYKQGLLSEKEALKYLPHVENQVSKALAKDLLRRFTKDIRSS